MLIQIVLILFGILICIFVIKPLIIMMKIKLQFGSKCGIQFGIYAILGLCSTSIIDKMKRKQIPKTIKFIVHNYASTVQILIIDPDYYQYMLINHENYSYINDLNTNQLLEEGIMFQQGEKWKQQRELYIQYFNLDKLKNNIPPINKIIQKHIKQYDQQNDKIQTLLLRIMSDILILSFFGEDANKLQINKKCIGLETIDLFQALQTLSSKPYSICKTILFGVQALKMFPNSEEQIIQTRINNIKFQIEKTIQKRIVQHELKLDEDENEISKMSDDFLNIYIQTYLQSKKGNNKISLEEIKQQFFTFFRIGIQTTTQIIYSSLHYLAEQPEIQNELRQEIMSIGGAEIIQSKELNSFVHLSAFFNEVLRFFNPIPIVRKVQTSHFIKDLKLDRDWVVSIDYSVSNFQEKYYDNPKEFNYKRWLQSKSIKENNDYVFIPFSNGPRNCVAQNLVTIIYKIILANILRNYEVTKNEKSKSNKQVAFVQLDNSLKLRPIHQK